LSYETRGRSRAGRCPPARGSRVHGWHQQVLVETDTAHPSSCTLHPIPYTLLPTPYPILPTPYWGPISRWTVSTCSMVQGSRMASPITACTLQFTPSILYPTHYTLHPTPYTLLLTPYSPPHTGDRSRAGRCPNCSMVQSFGFEGIRRQGTTPLTPQPHRWFLQNDTLLSYEASTGRCPPARGSRVQGWHHQLNRNPKPFIPHPIPYTLHPTPYSLPHTGG